MVNLPPDPNDRQPPEAFRDKDEAIAVAIAFLAVGTILFWGWTRGQRTFVPAANLPQLLEEPLLEDGALSDEAIEEDSVLGRPRTFDAPVDTPLEDAEILEDDTVSRRTVADEDIDTTLDLDDEGVAPIVQEDLTAEDVEVPAEEATPFEEDSVEAEVLPPLDISDVAENYWAYPYIVTLFEEGLLPDLPEGELRPDQQMTRAELAALLNSSFVQNEPEERDLAFEDISDTYWAADAIRHVVDAGYMTGYPDDTFRPDELVPRYQVLVTLATGLGLADPADPQAVLNRYQGAEELPEWSLGQVAAAAENSIVVNHPEPQALAPQEPATRAEIIVMIYQALVEQGRVEAIASPFVAPE
ncbi:S-layer homology domain-containing protein [Oscillatoria sp. CS-180]|uniref:S-layer homology domain-containing protein n=1 Tax=Oscillatoria sp. CS-180 TaxID=3021720 RepID=UPI00232FFF69|nr:S-layer homology domain-containing protein [Oscillatoria sp. CS-180]MDB9525818.1 S-layer homology domain-containing protein [Oscillatoria sp. CS-180]